MIIGKLTAKSQTTIPKAVRIALGLKPGDEIAWEIEDDAVRLISVSKDKEPDPFLDNFEMFTEWASEEDCKAFDNL